MSESATGSWPRTLESLDSHERPILFQWATGRRFEIGDEVRGQLEKTIHRKIPADAFVAMDYTLDWLYAATVIQLGAEPSTSPQPWPANPSLLQASIEDIDLLIAWEDNGPHTVMVEAKGFTGWTNKQMQSKINRIAAIFASGLEAVFDVHFVMTGPKLSKGLKTADWPEWTGSPERRHFVPIPDPGTRYAVQRCTADGKPTSHMPTHWQLVERKWVSGTPAPIEGLLPAGSD